MTEQERFEDALASSGGSLSLLETYIAMLKVCGRTFEDGIRALSEGTWDQLVLEAAPN